MILAVSTSYGNGNSQALRLCKRISEIVLPLGEELIFDFRLYGENNPFSNLVLINSIKECRRKYPSNPMACIPKSDSGYLEHIGFYKTIGIDYGKNPGEARPNSTYVPISEIEFDDHFYNSCEKEAENLSNTVGIDEHLQGLLKYMLIETIRNVFEHSGAKKVLVASQKWPSRKEVEIAIADSGCGIYKSLSSKVPGDNQTVLKMACQPGISACSNYGYLEASNPYRNSGYGLFVLKELIKKYSGLFLLCSGNDCLAYFSNLAPSFLKTNYSGTALCLRFKTDVNVDFEKTRIEILEAGKLIAKQYAGAIKTPSMSSGGRYRK